MPDCHKICLSTGSVVDNGIFGQFKDTNYKVSREILLVNELGLNMGLLKPDLRDICLHIKSNK